MLLRYLFSTLVTIALHDFGCQAVVCLLLLSWWYLSSALETLMSLADVPLLVLATHVVSRQISTSLSRPTIYRKA